MAFFMTSSIDDQLAYEQEKPLRGVVKGVEGSCEVTFRTGRVHCVKELAKEVVRQVLYTGGVSQDIKGIRVFEASGVVGSRGSREFPERPIQGHFWRLVATFKTLYPSSVANSIRNKVDAALEGRLIGAVQLTSWTPAVDVIPVQRTRKRAALPPSTPRYIGGRRGFNGVTRRNLKPEEIKTAPYPGAIGYGGWVDEN